MEGKANLLKNDTTQTPSRFNGVPDEDELFLDLRGQVQGEPRDRSSIRVVHASLQPPPLNVTATRNRNSGLRTVQLAENIGSEQKNSIAQPSLSPSHTRKGFKPGRPPCRVPTVMRPGPAAARTSSQTRWKVPSLKRPGSAMPAAVRDSNVGVIGAAGGAGGAGPVGPTRQIQQEPAPIRLAGRMPLPAPATLSHVLPSPTISSQAQEQGSSTNGDKNGACARKRPVGPRPRPLVSSPYTAEAEHNLFNQEGENTYAVSTQNTTQQSHESMGTQIRNIQQLYQAWPSRLPPSRSKDDKDDTLFTNNQQRGHVVLIQEPDLVYLLSRGILVLKPDSLSNAPAWLLDYGRTGYHDEDEDKDGDQTTGSSADDRLCHKSATRSVRVVEKSSSTASLWASRVRSQMAQIEQINSPKEEDESPMFPKGRGRPQQVRGWPFAASTFADSGEHKMAESRSPLANSELTLSTQQKPKKIDVLSMPSGQDSPPVYGTMSRLSCEGSTEDDAWMLVTPSHGGPGSVSSSRSGSQATTHWSSHVSVSSVTL